MADRRFHHPPRPHPAGLRWGQRGQRVGLAGVVLLCLLMVVVPQPPVQAHPAASCQPTALGLNYNGSGGAGGAGQSCPSGVNAPPPVANQPTIWVICLAGITFFYLNTENLPGWPLIAYSQGQFLQFPFWALTFYDDGTTPYPTLVAWQGRTQPCNATPPLGGNPIIPLQFNIWAFAPAMIWGGSSACPPGSSAGGVCPPTVGQPIVVWVSGYRLTGGAFQQCSGLLQNFLDYDTYSVCLMWFQSWPIRWDFNDETVSGQRLWGANYGVPEWSLGPGAAVSHTYEYGSAYDPLGGCVRPCPGDLLGPSLPTHPAGSPAFQVRIQTIWWLQACQTWTIAGASGGGCFQVDLTTLGANAATYTAVARLPIPVLEYGASPP